MAFPWSAEKAAAAAQNEPASEPLTRVEIEEALTNMAATAARMPTHWVARKAAIHERINALLDQLDQTA